MQSFFKIGIILHSTNYVIVYSQSKGNKFKKTNGVRTSEQFVFILRETSVVCILHALINIVT